MIKERRLHPVIVFSFARRELELLASDVAHKLNFSTDEEAENIEQVFSSAIQVP
jgi:superfamily II RNA helicase